MSTKRQFIESIKQEERTVTVFLTNGVKLTGKITEVFGYEQANGDYTGFIMERGSDTQLVEAHAVATVMKTEVTHGNNR